MKKKFLAAVMALVMIGTTPVGVFADTMVKSYLTGLDVPEAGMPTEWNRECRCCV